MIRTATALLATACIAVAAQAQMQRAFPQNALRGSLVIGIAPDIVLNGDRGRLAPGSRIRDAANMVAARRRLRVGQRREAIDIIAGSGALAQSVRATES